MLEKISFHKHFKFVETNIACESACEINIDPRGILDLISATFEHSSFISNTTYAGFP